MGLIRINLHVREDSAPELFTVLERVAPRKRGEVVRRLAMQTLCSQPDHRLGATGNAAPGTRVSATSKQSDEGFDQDLAQLLGQQG